MVTVFLIGRIIFALYWLNNAYNHIVNAGHMVGYAGSKGVKSPMLAIRGSGILLLLGGLSVLLGVYTNIGLALIVIFLVGVSFKMHPYWKETDPMAKMNERVAFMKNMALIGATLMMYQLALPWAYSL